MTTVLIDTLKERILTQFSSSPNVIALFENIYAELENCNNLLVFMKSNFDLNSATGVSLDILGEIVGVDRQYKELDADLVFTFRSVGEESDPAKGFFAAAVGGYMQSDDGLTEKDVGISTDKQDDDEYRKLIMAKAVANNAGGSIPDIFTHLLNGFDVWSTVTTETVGEVLIDLEDYLSKRERNYIQLNGPVPAGCRIEFVNGF